MNKNKVCNHKRFEEVSEESCKLLHIFLDELFEHGLKDFGIKEEDLAKSVGLALDHTLDEQFDKFNEVGQKMKENNK